MGLKPENVGRSGQPFERSWTSADVLLYALAVGAGQDDAGAELAFTTDNSSDVDLKVLPSFANLLGFGAGMEFAGDFDLAAVLHAEQSFELHRPLPAEGATRTVGTLAGIHDKGHAALVVAESTTTDARTGEPLATCRNTTFIRGAGGFGGERGTSPAWPVPERAPDLTRTAAIPRDQALLYRLTGDRNPLHSDPAFAKLAGFERPILHGMCTYGYTARLLLHAVCGSDVARFTAMSARFSDVVYPGDTITVQAWEDGSTVYFRTLARDVVVIDRGVLKRAFA
jgi:acyl dehydratase